MTHDLSESVVAQLKALRLHGMASTWTLGGVFMATLGSIFVSTGLGALPHSDNGATL